MARLAKGEREHRFQRIYRLLHRYRWGITEQEIAHETGLDRRTVNNYLRALHKANKAYKEGKYWYAE